MLRHGNPAESVLVYATFFALSIAVHLIIILGTRTPPTDATTPADLTQTQRAPNAPAPADTRAPQRPDRASEDLVSAEGATR